MRPADFAAVADGRLRVAFTLDVPISANRYWRVQNGVVVVSKEAKAYRESVGWQLRAQDVAMLDGDLILYVDVYRKRKAGDLDNALKCLLDSLQGVVYANDSQIVAIHARRFDDKANPRVEVVVEAKG